MTDDKHYVDQQYHVTQYLLLTTLFLIYRLISSISVLAWLPKGFHLIYGHNLTFDQ